jgi:hypothetical protein
MLRIRQNPVLNDHYTPRLARTCYLPMHIMCVELFVDFGIIPTSTYFSFWLVSYPLLTTGCEPIDQCGNHFMACEELSGRRINRHKLLVEKTVTYWSRAGVVIATEAPIPEGRMDIALQNPNKFPSCADISITHPCLKSYLDGAAVKRYISYIAKNLHFFPLVMETYGFKGVQNLYSKD